MRWAARPRAEQASQIFSFFVTQLRQLIEQRLGVFQNWRIETFSEPAVDRSKQIAGFDAFALAAPQAREAERRRAQFEGSRPLSVGNGESPTISSALAAA